jgi:FkbM family methyltransferase
MATLTLIRTLAERATRRLVLKRRLPSRFGGLPIYVSPEGGLRYLRPALERTDPVLLDLAFTHVTTAAVIWDIGANVGLFSLASAALAGSEGRVIAVEPDTWLVQLLRRSAGCPGDKAPVEVFPAAVGDRVGVHKFFIARRSRSTNYLDGYGNSQTGGWREHQLVPTVTLDWMLDHFLAPDLLKIDVEGAEAAVLSGASRLLAEVRPPMICEVSSKNQIFVTQLLRHHGYLLLDANLPPPRHPLDSAAYLTLALPSSRSNSIPK